MTGECMCMCVSSTSCTRTTRGELRETSEVERARASHSDAIAHETVIGVTVSVVMECPSMVEALEPRRRGHAAPRDRVPGAEGACALDLELDARHARTGRGSRDGDAAYKSERNRK